MTSSVFTKIIEREIPSQIVYETNLVIAFLDIHPESPGHLLLVPKIQTDHFEAVEEPYYTGLWQAAKVLSKKLEKITGCERVFVKIIGTDVPHCHVHLIPYYGEGLKKPLFSESETRVFVQEMEALLE